MYPHRTRKTKNQFLKFEKVKYIVCRMERNISLWFTWNNDDDDGLGYI